MEIWELPTGEVRRGGAYWWTWSDEIGFNLYLNMSLTLHMSGSVSVCMDNRDLFFISLINCCKLWVEKIIIDWFWPAINGQIHFPITCFFVKQLRYEMWRLCSLVMWACQISNTEIGLRNEISGLYLCRLWAIWA